MSDKLKLKVFSINNLDVVLKGLVRIASGSALVVSNKGTKIAANCESKIRAFINTDALKLETDDDDDSVELCFENLSNLLKTIAFIKDIGEAEKEAEFTYDGLFLKYSSKGSLKLKLDKRERVEPFITTPIKSELKNLFSFPLSEGKIKKILNYSQFNPNYEVKLYFYIKDKTLMCDIDDKKEMAGRLTSVSIPITKEYSGVLDKPFVLDLNDLRKFNIFDQPEIKCVLTDKCLKVATTLEDETKSSMVAIVRLLKD